MHHQCPKGGAAVCGDEPGITCSTWRHLRPATFHATLNDVDVFPVTKFLIKNLVGPGGDGAWSWSADVHYPLKRHCR